MAFITGQDRCIIGFLFFLSFLSISALASPAAKTAKTFDIPLNRFKSPAETFSSPRADGERLVFSISSWAPVDGSNQTLDHQSSRLKDATPFTGQSLPLLSVSYISFPFEAKRIGTLSLKAGMGLLPLVRSGTLTWGGRALMIDQDLYVLPVQLGAEFYPYSLQWKWGSAFIEAAMVPTVGLLEETALSDGDFLLGASGQLGAGVIIRLSQQMDLDLAISQAAGRLQSIPLNATSARVGLRVGI